MSFRTGCNLDATGRDGTYCAYSGVFLRRKARHADYLIFVLKRFLLARISRIGSIIRLVQNRS